VKSATIICRLSSRHGLAYYQRLQEELPKRGVSIVEAHMVRRRKDFKKRIRQAVKSGAGLIVVIGGDGTQTAAVAELVHSDSVMAVVPAGTGNSFAYTLGIKDDIDAAIETIVNGKELRVDVGIVNGTYFANFATVGIIADAATRTPRNLKKFVGPVAYGVTALLTFLREKPFEMRVKWKKQRLKIVTHQAIVASGRYFGWQPLTPHANPRDGAHYFCAPKITVVTKPKQALNIDGHGLGKTPAKFSVAPRALRVLVPQDYQPQS
jgi:YegS/Rv2252/BmrU family lipid kinase